MIDPVEFFADPWWSRADVMVAPGDDGDTFWFFIDNKRRNFSEEQIRLQGMDTWELNQPLGKPAKLFAALWFAGHRHGVAKHPYVFRTDRDKRSFTRYVAAVWCSQGHYLADALRANGFEKSA